MASDAIGRAKNSKNTSDMQMIPEDFRCEKRCEFLNHFKDFEHKAEHGLTKQTRLEFQKSGNASELKISRASNKKDKNNNSETITDVQTLVPYLHHDIWFDILSWLSAICLYNIMSRVCNTWATIIRHPDFVEKHLLRSRSGIFIQGRPTRFLDLTNNNVEITYIKLKYLLEN